eukprot:2633688-Pyramimonas_sp.AAC.1
MRKSSLNTEKLYEAIRFPLSLLLLLFEGRSSRKRRLGRRGNDGRRKEGGRKEEGRRKEGGKNEEGRRKEPGRRE